MADYNDPFSADKKPPIDTAQIIMLAELAADLDDKYATLKKECTETSEKVLAAKTELAIAMQLLGLSSIRLENGLTPTVKPQRKFSINKDVSPEQAHAALVSSGFGDLIKPTVNYNSLNSALNSYYDDEDSLPEDLESIINKSEIPSVVLHGKSKYIQNRKD